MTVIERERVVTETERRARVLEAAALEIEVRGWHQGRACDEVTGAVCLLGGIAAAIGLEPSVADTNAASWTPWGCEDLNRHGIRIFEWNDAYDRTADEVTFLLRWRAQEIRDGR